MTIMSVNQLFIALLSFTACLDVRSEINLLIPQTNSTKGILPTDVSVNDGTLNELDSDQCVSHIVRNEYCRSKAVEDEGPLDADLPVYNFDKAVLFTLMRRQNNLSDLKRGTVSVKISPDAKDSTLLQVVASDKPVKFLVHGWRGNGNSQIINEFARAYVVSSDVNVVKVDWSVYAQIRPKPLAASFVKIAGREVAAMVNRLLDAGAATKQNVHLIGFSLGAHVVGNAGSAFTPRLGRVTGLDPTGMDFEDSVQPKDRLDPTDAVLVDAIHTNGRVTFHSPIGHIDFYPNGGLHPQPGCQSSMSTPPRSCSHNRAYEYFAESIYKGDAFMAVKCTNWSAFLKDECTGNITTFMGKPAGLTSRQNFGTYFLQTNPESPYGH